jgi:hypothetical protein
MMKRKCPESICFLWVVAVWAGQRWIVEKLWQEFFSDPSQWWDHRSEKVNKNHGCPLLPHFSFDAGNL